jgi:phosphate starvation-inducible PhoH-like protein
MGKRKERKRFNEGQFFAPPILAQTPNQEKLINAISYNDQIITTGSAGTGKTFITAGLAADWYARSPKRKIVITRPMVCTGDEFGHLPGDLDEKTTPWALPVLEVIKQRVGANKLKCDLSKNIEIVALQMMRGRTFDDSWVLADECQNLTIEQAQMLVTRIGINSKLLINGDLKQKDIPSESGLSWLIQNIKRNNLPIPIVEFNLNDCQRSEICRMWLEVIEKGY